MHIATALSHIIIIIIIIIIIKDIYIASFRHAPKALNIHIAPPPQTKNCDLGCGLALRFYSVAVYYSFTQ